MVLDKVPDNTHNYRNILKHHSNSRQPKGLHYQNIEELPHIQYEVPHHNNRKLQNNCRLNLDSTNGNISRKMGPHIEELNNSKQEGSV